MIKPALTGLLMLAASLSGSALEASPSPAGDIDVLHYTATVAPDIAQKSLKGQVAIDFVLKGDSAEIGFDIGGLTVDAVRVGSAQAEFSQGDRRLRVRLGGVSSGRRRVNIDYHGTPRFGLQFVPELSQAYTIFSTSQWMPCVDAPSDRATLDLTIVAPEGLTVVATGDFKATSPFGDGRVRHEWRGDHEAPTYTFGFAMGRFHEVSMKAGRTRLTYLAAEASADELRRIFADTPRMLAFFEEVSGVRFPHADYRQALVHETIGQEMSGLSLMSEEYGRRVLDDPEAVGLIAHELAHQWWGNGATCREWTHFWLNEGVATFMAAAYREKRFGRAVYLKDVAGWRERYERVRAAGKDRSLVFPDWNKPTSDDRALVYQKGALVLHELRGHLGDRAFWKGIRDYTRAHARGSVVTADFQRAMETSAGRDLSAFFNEWVYMASKAVP